MKYSKVKKIILKIIPWKVILKNEFFLRKLYSVFYLGRSVYCNICERHFSNFLKIHADDKICPKCGSLARHRRLWYVIHHEITMNKTDRILDFSPSRIFLKKLKSEYSNYLTTDFQENTLVDKRYDITRIPEPTASFHWIICYHVLEHIENDLGAMRELYRILKKNGSAVIQTPFKEGEIYENREIVTDEERLIHFGQEDHVRIYSVSGLQARLQSVGFNVKILEYKADQNLMNSFKPVEFVILATK